MNHIRGWLTKINIHASDATHEATTHPFNINRLDYFIRSLVNKYLGEFWCIFVHGFTLFPEAIRRSHRIL